MTQMLCNFFYKIWMEYRYEKCPRTWFLVKNWSKYDYVKHAKIKKTPCTLQKYLEVTKILRIYLKMFCKFRPWWLKLSKWLTNKKLQFISMFLDRTFVYIEIQVTAIRTIGMHATILVLCSFKLLPLNHH